MGESSLVGQWFDKIKRMGRLKMTESKQENKTTKDAISAIKADQILTEQLIKNIIEQFEEEHDVVVSAIRLDRINVSQMGQENEILLERVRMLVAISPELALA
jgi:hypothetical protein